MLPFQVTIECKGGVCLVGEKPDKELSGIVVRVEILSRTEDLSYMMCVINFVFALLKASGC